MSEVSTPMLTRVRLQKNMNTQVSMGTLVYMSPEQIQGKPRKESDQYALAITAYQWLTGELPFQGSSTEIIAQHLAVPAPPLRTRVANIPEAVEQVILKALAKDPKERYEQIQNFAIALERAVAQGAREVQANVVTELAIPNIQTIPAPQAFLSHTPAVPVQRETPLARPPVMPVTPRPPTPPQAQHPTRSKPKPPAWVFGLLSLALLVTSVWTGVAWLDTSYQALTRNAPDKTYTMRDTSSQKEWPRSTNSDTCAYSDKGFVVKGNNTENVAETDLQTQCAGKTDLGSGDILIQATMQINTGACGGIEFNNLGVVICDDGNYGTLNGTNNSSAFIDIDYQNIIHQGFGKTNTLAVLISNGDHIKAFVNGTALPGQDLTFYSGDLPDKPDLFTLLSGPASEVLFTDVKYWRQTFLPYKVIFWVSITQLPMALILWLIWFIRGLSKPEVSPSKGLPPEVFNLSRHYQLGNFTRVYKTRGTGGGAIGGGIALVVLGIVVLLGGRVAGVEGTGLFYLALICVIAGITLMVRRPKGKQQQVYLFQKALVCNAGPGKLRIVPWEKMISVSPGAPATITLQDGEPVLLEAELEDLDALKKTIRAELARQQGS